MNVKLLLAEGLDVLRCGEEREQAADRLCEQMSKRSAAKRNFSAVRKEYSIAYNIFINGLEMINHCRRTAINVGDDELIRFCTDKMNSFMDRCEALRAKEGNILVSVSQVEATGGMDKEGYDVGESLFVHDPTKPVKGGNPIGFEGKVTDGAFQLLVKNLDDYTIAAPVIQAALQVTSASGKVQLFRKSIPARCAWSRYVGVVDAATIKVVVASDAWMRSSSVEVNLRKLVPTDEASPVAARGGNAQGISRLGKHWVDALPPIPTMDDLMMDHEGDADATADEAVPIPTDDSHGENEEQLQFPDVPSCPIDLNSKQVDSESDQEEDVKQLQDLDRIAVPHVRGARADSSEAGRVVPSHADACASSMPKPQAHKVTEYITPLLAPPVGLRERLKMASLLVEQFPVDGVRACSLARPERELLHCIQSLPMPTVIDVDQIDFGEFDLADLGDEIE